jgi:hypothetical protein
LSKLDGDGREIGSAEHCRRICHVRESATAPLSRCEIRGSHKPDVARKPAVAPAAGGLTIRVSAGSWVTNKRRIGQDKRRQK